MENNELIAKIDSVINELNAIKAALSGDVKPAVDGGKNGTDDIKSTALYQKIVSVLSGEFECEPDVIDLPLSIKDTLQLDSLSLVDLKALLSDEFGVDVPNEDFFNIKTFQNLYDYLVSKNVNA